MLSSLIGAGKSILGGIGMGSKLGSAGSKIGSFINDNKSTLSGMKNEIGSSIAGVQNGGDVASGIVSGALNVASMIPGPVGWVASGLKIVDNLLSKKMNVSNADINDEVDASGSFEELQGSEASLNEKIGKQNNRGGIVKLFGKGKRDALKKSRSLLEERANKAGQEIQEGKEDILAAQNEAIDQSVITSNRLNNASRVINTAQFKNGGVVNVIIDGKLHAHNHGMEKLEEFEDADLTKKGVPVIINQEGGEIKQVAEFETGEVVLNNELMAELEKLKRENTNESKIKAGEILAHELLFNTKDNSEEILKMYE